MKQIFTYTFYAKKVLRPLLLLLILLVAMPVIETQQAEAQTTKTGNFFTRRFKRKNKFQRKAKNSTAFKRKPFKCSEVGKQKIEQIKVSKKQLRRWEDGVHSDWLNWMKETHIPDVMNTGMFSENKILKLLSKLPEEEGTTYAVQYFCKSLEDLEHYQQNFAPKLQEDHLKRYGNKVIAFRTILEVI